jgi:uncharacterized protein (TIGR02996 family)
VTDYATHPDWLALMRGICERPDDDLPRLVAADWLEERGTPEAEARATFVRAQVAFAAMPIGWHMSGEGRGQWCDRAKSPVHEETGPTPGCECEPCRLLRAAGEALAQTYWRRLLGPRAVCEIVMGSGINCFPCRRGFPFRLSLPLAAFLAHAADLFRAAPFTEVEVTDREPQQSGGRYYWYDEDRYSPRELVPISAELPTELYFRLVGSGVRWTALPSADAADAALSAACVSYGRELAGLPPLSQ